MNVSTLDGPAGPKGPRGVPGQCGFKTLAEARSAYDMLAARFTDLEQKQAGMAELEAELCESKAFGATTATENENFRLLIVQKDEEISALKAEKQTLSERISEFKTEVETLKKEQKTAKTHARELVAASGGAPIAIDQAEIAKMQAGNEREFLQEMAKEMNPAELSRLYREYNRLFRPNGKTKKD
jgi:chromosome segregation ATPase